MTLLHPLIAPGLKLTAKYCYLQNFNFSKTIPRILNKDSTLSAELEYGLNALKKEQEIKSDNSFQNSQKIPPPPVNHLIKNNHFTGFFPLNEALEETV